MRHSEDRILTTHAGSLPRPSDLGQMFARASRHEPVDQSALAAAVEAATRDVIRRQHECGIDIGNNGEQPRESFFTYVQHRMSGFGGRSERPRFKDVWEYPTFTARMAAMSAGMSVDLLHAPQALGAVAYRDRAPLEREIADYLRLARAQQSAFVESFMTAPSPGIIASAMLNQHYATLGDYVMALADALRVEYEAIVASGLVLLQIDAPDLAMERHVSYGERPLREFQEFVELVVAGINRALENIPRDRVRLHVCWGNYEGPHHHDVELPDILPILLQAKVDAMLLSMANPRHEHDYHCFERTKLPAGMMLLAGVIDSTTNYVEHPEVVAERLERAARAVGDPQRIIAATDCGFETTVGLSSVAEELVWVKLAALRDGAALASRRLFG
ncbi:MAG TPA: cobalamin-independent methionine synthase II family protein [Candidatus Binataceae bacterium]|nr:cobalamin-independent methionine synthase II family protein [Candidatus Binataceae bacterium]